MTDPKLEYENYTMASNFYDKTRIPAGYNMILKYIKDDFKTLDAGCGTGNYLCAIAPYVKEVVAFELNDGMLK